VWAPDPQLRTPTLNHLKTGPENPLYKCGMIDNNNNNLARKFQLQLIQHGQDFVKLEKLQSFKVPKWEERITPNE